MATSSWRLRRGGELDQFFTSERAGAILVELCEDALATKVLDLGCGEGSLSQSALTRLPVTTLVTADLDHRVAEVIYEKVGAKPGCNHTHITADVFDPSLPDLVGRSDFDLAVCNPPFFRPRWQNEFVEVLRSAGLEQTVARTSEFSAEILFLAQNLRLLTDGGLVALIVPNGLAVGHNFRRFRSGLMERHTVRSVAQLPPYAFSDTEAQCFIMLIEKGAPQNDKPVKLLGFDDDMRCKGSLEVEPREASSRMDYDYHQAFLSSVDGLTTLRSLGADIQRGSLSSVQRRNADFRVFHTGDFDGGPSRLKLPVVQRNEALKKVVFAEAGDILLARVDRHLERKIALVEAGCCPVTDCIFRIRLPEDQRERVYGSLSDAFSQQCIKATTKGVGARVLGKGDLLDLPIIKALSVVI